jgi:hypothetical protein
MNFTLRIVTIVKEFALNCLEICRGAIIRLASSHVHWQRHLVILLLSIQGVGLLIIEIVRLLDILLILSSSEFVLKGLLISDLFLGCEFKFFLLEGL